MLPQLATINTLDKVASHKATPFVIGGLVLAGIGLTYYVVVRPILCVTGTITCQKAKRALNLMNYKGFDPNYYRPLKVTISSQRAKQLADQIYESAGVFNDQEGKIYAALETAGNADNLSYISKLFAIRHQKSMAEHIMNALDDAEEQDRIQDILENH